MTVQQSATRGPVLEVSAKKNEEASQISRLQSEVNELKKMLAAQHTGQGPDSAPLDGAPLYIAHP